MKAARHGHSIKEIFDDHDYGFYLPKKKTYFPSKKAKLMRLNTGSSNGNSSFTNNKSKLFKTEVPDSQFSSVRVKPTERTYRSKTSMKPLHKRNASMIVQHRRNL